MSYQRTVLDYESVSPARSVPRNRDAAARRSSEELAQPETLPSRALPEPTRGDAPVVPLVAEEGWWSARRGHALSYFGLFIFTVMLFFRPYEYIPALASMQSLAFWPAVITLAIFFPTQVSLEGTLTARPREVNLVLLLGAAALISIPLAINPGEAWATFNDVFLKAVLMFIVIINSVRTEKRLNALLWLALATSFALSVNAINDYRLGNFAVEGYRVKGSIGGMFRNPNDLALHLVTMIPIAAGLLLGTRNTAKRLMLAACVLLCLAALVVTFSRGGFLGLMCVAACLGWKIGRRNRLGVTLLLLFGAGIFLALSPGEYANRLASISDFSLDPNGSASARHQLLIRSVLVTLNNPVFGVGMGNFHIVSIHEFVSHNAYTQVSAELGIAAVVVYVMFMLTPLKRLRRVERETFGERASARFYYLAIGLQASLIGYMVSSFFASVAYHWNIYYLVGYAVAFRRIYVVHQRQLTEAGGGQPAAESRPSNPLFEEAEEAGVRS